MKESEMAILRTERAIIKAARVVKCIEKSLWICEWIVNSEIARNLWIWCI